MSWTIETLKQHLEAMMAESDRRHGQQFADSQKAIEAALSAAKEAVTKAEHASEKRFEGVNEFRSTLADQQRTLMPRTEVEVLFQGLTERVKKLEVATSNSSSEQAGTKAGYVWAIGVVAVIGVILAVVSAISMLVQGP
jgi:hypothetical protein